MSAVAQRFADPLGVFEGVGPVLEDGHRLLGFLDVVEQPGILPDEREDDIPEVLFLLLEGPDGTVVGGLTTPDTEVLVAGGLLPAAGMLDGSNRGLFFLLAPDTVNLREFAVGRRETFPGGLYTVTVARPTEPA